MLSIDHQAFYKRHGVTRRANIPEIHIIYIIVMESIFSDIISKIQFKLFSTIIVFKHLFTH